MFLADSVNLNIKFNIERVGLMEHISILQFRREAEAIIRKVQKGQRLIVTYRGKPVMRLEPIHATEISPDDPFYSLDQLAIADGGALTNEEIDTIVYED